MLILSFVYSICEELRINQKQFKTKNFKGVLSLLAGNTISKLILSVGGIVLANYYGPESYGIYNVFLSYILILPVLASMRLDNIMILQKGSKEIRNLFSGIVVITFFLSCLLVLGIGILKNWNIFPYQLSNFLLLLIGIGSVLTAWNLSQNNLFTKFRLFKQISTAFIISSLITVLFQAVFYFTGQIENGLIYGWIIGLAASFLYNAAVSKGLLKKIDWTAFRASVKEHQNIVKFTYPSDSLNAIANNLLPIMVILYFSEAEVGLYAMAFKILSTPLVLLSSSVSRVYFQKSVSLYHQDKSALLSLTQKVIFSNLSIIIAFVLFMNTAGLYLLDLFLNHKWDGMGSFIMALSFWIIARSALNPISPLIMVINKNHYSLVFNIYLILVNLVSIYIGNLYENFLLCVWIFSIFSGLGYLILTLLVTDYLKKQNEV